MSLGRLGTWNGHCVVGMGMELDLDPHTITAETRDYVRAIALRIVRDPADAEDVAQDALVLAFRHRASFRGDCRYTTWLHRVTQTAALMFLRKRRRYRRERTGGERGEAPDEVRAALERAAVPASAEKVAACREELARTRQVIARLGRRYPEVFWMRYGEGYTETEIARALGLSLSTVKTRAHRAKVAVQTSRQAA